MQNMCQISTMTLKKISFIKHHYFCFVVVILTTLLFILVNCQTELDPNCGKSHFQHSSRTTSRPPTSRPTSGRPTTEETEEPTEGTTEPTTEGTEEPTEGTTEPATEETTEPTTEETAEPTEETAEPTEETAEPTTEGVAQFTSLPIAYPLHYDGNRMKNAFPKAARMINGITIGKRNEFPQFVGVISQFLFVEEHCSGTLLAPDLVVTAGHCIKNRGRIARRVIVGNSMYGTREYRKKGVRVIDARSWCLSRYYNEFLVTHDLAIIVLAEPISYNDDNQPACLPNGRSRGECYMLGIGLSNSDKRRHRVKFPTKMQYMPVEHVKNCPAARDYSQACYKTSKKSKKGKPCSGDSGGPVLCKNDGRWEIHALVSKGPLECSVEAANSPNDLSVFFDVVAQKTELLQLVDFCRMVGPNSRRKSSKFEYNYMSNNKSKNHHHH